MGPVWLLKLTSPPPPIAKNVHYILYIYEKCFWSSCTSGIRPFGQTLNRNLAIWAQHLFYKKEPGPTLDIIFINVYLDNYLKWLEVSFKNYLKYFLLLHTNYNIYLSIKNRVTMNWVSMIMINYATMFKHLFKKRLDLIEYI